MRMQAARAVTNKPPAGAEAAPRAQPAIRTILRRPAVQPKLTVGAVNDPAEREADQVAGQVMRMAAPGATAGEADQPSIARRDGVVQRMCADCEHEKEQGGTLRRRAATDNAGTTATDAAPSSVHQVLRSTGQPLDAATRAFMEPRFGRDFSQVRVHTGPKAADSAQAIQALAYTAGHNVVFGAGQYAPGSGTGRHILAHELTHVVQQGAAGAPGPAGFVPRSAGGGAAVQRLGDLSKIPTGLSCVPPTTTSSGTTESILFGNKATALDPLSELQVEDFVSNWHAAGGDQPVRVDGYASTKGKDELNWTLSCDRAQTVVNALATPPSGAPGIPSGFITFFMQGETAEFGTEEQNRRVTLSLGLSPPAPTPTSTPTSTPTPTPPTAPAATTSNCTAAQIADVNTDLAEARIWVDDAETQIAAFAAGTASTAVSAVVITALTANFHTTTAADVATIAANFASLRTALNGTPDVECVSSFWCNPRSLAYVRGAFAWVRRLGDVNLCPPYFTCVNSFRRVATLPHEVAHQYPGADDKAYEWSAAYAALSPADAIDNAESYAVAARQIHHAGAHGPGESC